MKSPLDYSQNPATSAGKVIEDYIIKGLGIGVRQLAHALNVPPNRLYQIIQNKREITVDTAVRLGHFLNMDPNFWINIQTRCSIHHYLKEHASIKDEIKPLNR